MRGGNQGESSATNRMRVSCKGAEPAVVDWHKIFPDETTAVAAVDRLVHRATILEMNVESYRRREALETSMRKRGRPAKKATDKNTDTG